MRRFVCFACGALACFWAGAALAQQEGGPTIWDLSEAPRHWHTGLTCWSEAADAPLRQRWAYNSAGSDVSCGYISADSTLLITIYATQRPEGVSFADMVAPTREQVRSRYRGARVMADGARQIDTPAGPLMIDELALIVEGADLQREQDMRGMTGVWHADVAGWTLKLRLSRYQPGGYNQMLGLAEALIGRAFADMNVARACAGAGAQEAPNLNISDEEAPDVQVAAAALAPLMIAALPADPLAARRQGFVCLGETIIANDGAFSLALTPPPSAESAPGADSAVLIALGEAHPAQGPARMVGIFDSSMNPFGVEGARADRGHFVFAPHNGAAGFYGVITSGPVRRNAARIAAHILGGADPLLSVTAPD